MSINSYLTSVSSRAIISDAEKESIRTSINTLRYRLDYYFGSGIVNQSMFGSFTRGTILPRRIDTTSDVDYMVEFSDTTKQPQTYLDRLSRFANEKYSSSEISQSNPTIVLSLNHIRFDLVPAVKTGYYTQMLNIPAKATSYQNWIETDPTAFNDELLSKNGKHDYKIKPLIRLLKYWNSTHRLRPFESYELEQAVVRKSFVCSYFGPPSLTDYLFEFLEGMSVDYYSPQYKKDAIEKAKEIITAVKGYDSREMPINAMAQMKRLLPDF